MSKFAKDLAERVLWTAVQAGLAVLAVEVTNLDYAWVPAATVALAVAKGLVAKKVGDPDSAALRRG